MNRPLLSALAASVALGCNLGGTSASPYLTVSPILDTLFIGDSGAALGVTYYDASGAVQPAGVVTWSSSAPAVLAVDSLTGVRHALAAGSAVVTARARGVEAQGLGVVTRLLDLTILLDSLYLMPGDTFTVPVAVRHKAPGVPAVWFTAPANAVFTIDSASGRDSAKVAGGPLPFVVHAVLGADTVADTGTTEVVVLTDTVGGKGYFTVFGTVERRVKTAARALNYPRIGDSLTFRLRNYVLQGTTTVEATIITLLEPVTAPGTAAIDSISPAEALGSAPASDPVCHPPRAWGQWSAYVTGGRLDALSREGGTISITRIVPVTNGYAISGRYTLPAQRVDFYTDPDGLLAVRGTFVSPLIGTVAPCN